MDPSPPSKLHEQLSRAYALHRQGRLEEAARLYSGVTRQAPDNAEAWGLLAQALAALGRPERALEAARRAVAADPRQPAWHNQLGLALEELGDLEQALEAYRRVLELDPGSIQALNNLGNVYQKLGRLDEAVSAFNRALARGAPPLVRANLAAVEQRAGRHERAAESARRALADDPKLVGAWITLGLAQRELDRPDQALESLRHAVELEPENPVALNNLGLVLEVLNRPEEAFSAWDRALAARPGYTAARANRAALLENLGRIDEALEAARAGLDQAPEDPQLTWIAAKCERRAGRPEAALARLDTLPVESLSARWRQSIDYERGRLLDLLGRTGEAWDAFEHANLAAAERWRQRHPGPNLYARELEQAAQFLRETDPAAWSELPAPADGRNDPVFLVGFPRSGTTLLDRILDAHPDIAVVEEAPMLAKALEVIESAESGYPEALAVMDPGLRDRARQAYFDELDRRTDGARVIIDKLPLNAARAALIGRLFPRAKFILALRHPADACLSCFMQEFGFNEAMAHFYTLESTAAFYDRVMGLWSRSRERLDLDIHEVRYEDLIDDYQSVTRRLLAFLDLDWAKEIADYRTAAAGRGRTNTPSYHQVTRPIYTDARGRWVRYRPRLEPVLDRLASWCLEFGYSLDRE